MKHKVSNTQKVKDLADYFFETMMRKNVSKEISQKKYNICLSCEHLKKDRCELCGCFMSTKTKYTKATCPIGKW